MKHSTLLLIATCILAGCQSTSNQVSNDTSNDAQLELTLEEFCKNNPCRKNKHISFNTDNGPFEQVLPLYWPAAQGDRISILPGDELLIEAELLDGEKLGNFRQVRKMVDPSKTIKFSFTQMDSNVGMMLSVKNPFPFRIKYQLNMIDFTGQPHKTSSCPVSANMSVFESWPHPIPEMILTGMRKQKDSDDMVCTY